MEEAWQFRREARRCHYEAMRSESARRSSFFSGLAKFYETLAAEDIPSPQAGKLDGNGPHPASAINPGAGSASAERRPRS
jgi:hypothetical protein